jgi:hypothetical protein
MNDPHIVAVQEIYRKTRPPKEPVVIAPVVAEVQSTGETNQEPVVEVKASEEKEEKETDTKEASNKRKHVEGTAKLSLKKRHQKLHPDKGKRLCTFALRGDNCPYADQCQYSHDVFDYLSQKEPDIGS